MHEIAAEYGAILAPAECKGDVARGVSGCRQDTDVVADGEIIEILQRVPEPAAAAQALVDRALMRGGKDNVTVIVARYSIKPKK